MSIEMLQPVSQSLLEMKYLQKGEKTKEELLDRVASALAQVESKKLRDSFTKKFRRALDYCILGGRINASAGVEGSLATWINCFVEPVGDSVFSDDEDGIPGIMQAVKEAAQTMRLGGGVGYNFSRIRPKGSLIKGTQTEASGPISFMEIFNAMCGTVISSGLRRGAQMGILYCHHPDIEEFIVCKKVTDFNTPYHKRPFSNFNLSVAITDDFMHAVINDLDFELVHKAQPSEEQIKNGAYLREDGLWVYKKIRAKELYDKIMKATYERAEPGVIFIDTINKKNNLRYIELIEATNPCGEQCLPAYGCCDLGHLNLTKFVTPYWDLGGAYFDYNLLAEMTTYLVRMLDNVLDATHWPLEKQAIEAKNKRRIGVGFTGLADALALLGLKYNSEEALKVSEKIIKTIRDHAYLASIELAREKGSFPLLDVDKYLEEGTFASSLPDYIKELIKKYGIRNSHLLSLAPTGTGSVTLGNNCSSGCEPIFDYEQIRYVRMPDDTRKEMKLYDYAYLKYKEAFPDKEIPEHFQTIFDLSAKDHLAMMKTLAPYIDSSLSKTVNLPSDYPFEDFKDLYLEAWKCGLKGLTTYRPNDEVGAVLVSSKDNKVKATNDRESRIKLDKVIDHTKLPFIHMSDYVDPLFTDSSSVFIKCPYGDFKIHVNYHVERENYPIEVWVNGESIPRGLDVVARLISEDMKIKDTRWIEFKLNSLEKANGLEFYTQFYWEKEPTLVKSPVSALAKVLKYFYAKIDTIYKDSHSYVDYILFDKEPKTNTYGTLSWTVDIKNPSTQDDFVLFVKELELEDGSIRPYSVWFAGEYPKTFDAISRLLSLDMRVTDTTWIKEKLLKLTKYKEAQGDFFAPIPGEKKQKSYPSTLAYVAHLLLYRYEELSLIDKVEYDEHSHKKCPECGSKLMKYNGCDKCTQCGYIGSCG